MTPEIIVFGVISGAFVLGLMLFTYGRAHAILDAWAAQNGYEILSRRQAWFRGPFWLTSSKNQIVFRVTVRDRHGDVRKGWVRVGSWLFGVLSDEATEKWE
jgi:hypothetical protein